MSKWIVSALLCAGLTAACGGSDGSGVSRSKSLASLNDDEITDLCEYVAGGEMRTITCDDGSTVTLEATTVAECVTEQQAAPTTCDATVGDVEDCHDDTEDLSDEELCDGLASLPASCLPLLACAFE